MKGRELEEDAKTCSLGQLPPEGFRRALGDKLHFVKRRLGLEKHRTLAQAASSDAPLSVDVGALEPERAD
eukprot:14617804-Alexandrium_andersonii.AAC.1